jgi:hypothetical protein
MARKIKPPVEAPAPDSGAGDLLVLHPDATVTIGDRTVTIREYRFVSGLQVRAKSVRLVVDLKAQIESGSALVEEVIDVLAVHQELVRELILDAIDGADKEPARGELAAWIAGLGDAEGELLLLTWWGVCGSFFVRQIMRRWGQARQLKADLAQASAGATSTPASPLPDTATPTTSAPPTPNGS